MTQVLYVLLAIAVGVGTATQTSMLGVLSRAYGPTEAAWVSVLATICGLSVAFSLRSLSGNPPALPNPFEGFLIFIPIAVFSALAVFLAIKGLPSYLVLTGMFGFAYLISAAYLAPKIGFGVFAAASTAGTLIGAVALDHVGALGGQEHRLTLVRGLGVVALMAGVVLVRSGK